MTSTISYHPLPPAARTRIMVARVRSTLQIQAAEDAAARLTWRLSGVAVASAALAAVAAIMGG